MPAVGHSWGGGTLADLCARGRMSLLSPPLPAERAVVGHRRRWLHAATSKGGDSAGEVTMASLASPKLEVEVTLNHDVIEERWGPAGEQVSHLEARSHPQSRCPRREDL
eukprot:1844258-Amphidinium_carterae.2